MRESRGQRDLQDVRSDRTRDLEHRAGRRRGYRRAVRVGLAVSLVLHLALLLFLGRQLRVPDLGFRVSPSPTPVSEPGLELRQVRVREPQERAVPSPRRPARPEPAPREAEREEPTREPEETETTGEEEADRDLSNAEVLTPREGDPRLWREYWDEDVAGRYLGETTRADSALRAILGRYLDSLRLTDEQLRRARDWTFTEDGERWGISSDGIHLGDVTIPLPVGQLLSPTGPRRRELEQELRELRQIQRQEALGEAAETREERIEAMEERAREEREEGGAASDTSEAGGGG